MRREEEEGFRFTAGRRESRLIGKTAHGRGGDAERRRIDPVFKNLLEEARLRVVMDELSESSAVLSSSAQTEARLRATRCEHAGFSPV